MICPRRNLRDSEVLLKSHISLKIFLPKEKFVDCKTACHLPKVLLKALTPMDAF